MARCLSFVNLKGGVGKTSLAVNVAAHLSYAKEKKTLLVDMDPQSNASQWLLQFKLWKEINDNPEHSVYAIFLNDDRNVGQNLIQAPVKKDDDHVAIRLLDVLPASYRLMDLEHEYEDDPDNPYYLRFLHHIGIFFPHYEYIIFDCPPNLFRGSTCAIYASQEIYVPCNPDRMSYAGLSFLMEKIQKLRETLPPSPDKPFATIRGIIMNDANPRVKYREIEEEFRRKLAVIKRTMPGVLDPDAQIIERKVRSYEEARKALYEEKPVALRKGPLAEDYAAIANYIDHLESV